MMLGFCIVSALAESCPRDSVRVGTVCVDKYEASVWSIPVTKESLIKKVKRGKATLGDLLDGGAVQHGCGSLPYNHVPFPSTFPETGNWTAPLYAASVPGVKPTACITWFQARQACALADKRLLTNDEWQTAAASTPDLGTDNGSTQCNVTDEGDANEPANTGACPACVSAWGVFDLVGNVWEWVADWIQGDTNPWAPLTNGTTSTTYGDDLMSGTNPAQTQGNGQNFPAALERGGSFRYGNGTDSGVFALSAAQAPSASFVDLGFRCGR